MCAGPTIRMERGGGSARALNTVVIRFKREAKDEWLQLQGHEDVQGRDGERRAALGAYGRSRGRNGLDPSGNADRGWFPVNDLFRMWPPARGKALIVVISGGSGQRSGIDGPGIVNRCRDREEDQKIGEPPHLRSLRDFRNRCLFFGLGRSRLTVSREKANHPLTRSIVISCSVKHFAIRRK